MDKPGYYQGRHFTEHVAEVNRLLMEGCAGEVERLLLALIAATEAEDGVERAGVAPWYYDALAAYYEEADRVKDAVAVLQRFAAQRHAPGVRPKQLLAHLDELKRSPSENATWLSENGDAWQLLDLARGRLKETPAIGMSLAQRLDVLNILSRASERAADNCPELKARVRRLIGEVQLAAGNREQALECFRRAAVLDPRVGVKRLIEKLEKEMSSTKTGD